MRKRSVFALLVVVALSIAVLLACAAAKPVAKTVVDNVTEECEQNHGMIVHGIIADGTVQLACVLEEDVAPWFDKILSVKRAKAAAKASASSSAACPPPSSSSSPIGFRRPVWRPLRFAT